MSCKHLYRQYFTPAERRRLASIPLNDVSGEIQLLRVLLARTIAAVSSQPSLLFNEQIALLSALSRAAGVQASLVGLQGKYHGLAVEVGDTILEAIRSLEDEPL